MRTCKHAKRAVRRVLRVAFFAYPTETIPPFRPNEESARSGQCARPNWRTRVGAVALLFLVFMVQRAAAAAIAPGCTGGAAVAAAATGCCCGGNESVTPKTECRRMTAERGRGYKKGGSTVPGLLLYESRGQNIMPVGGKI